MSVFEVVGGKELKGSIPSSGNKNEALPLIAASLLSEGSVVFTNFPDIGDVKGMLEIASELGAEYTGMTQGRLEIQWPDIKSSALPVELSAMIRGSILFASSLLVRTRKAVIPKPGGDKIGRRRLDTHLLVFEALGAETEVKTIESESGIRHEVYELTAKGGLIGSEIHLDEASVTATENAVIAASGAEGKTVIWNAASEPHVQGLCRYLRSSGIEISGVGSNVLTVHGKGECCSTEHRIGSDYIETASFISLAAATRSSITIKNTDPQHLRMILFQFSRLGIEVDIDYGQKALTVRNEKELVLKNDLGGGVPKIEDSPWPGFPADLTSIILVTALFSQGTCLIHEKMFESRLFFVDHLIGMGARIVLCDPHRAVIVGPNSLYGKSISSPDIRAGMALLIAALAAEGSSRISNIKQIDRGYEKIDQRLRSLGADIKRINARRRSDDP